nr:hypothetical protein [Sinorhizobium meliloti]
MALEHERIDLTTVVLDVACDPKFVGALSVELNRMTKPVEGLVFVGVPEWTAPEELSRHNPVP